MHQPGIGSPNLEEKFKKMESLEQKFREAIGVEGGKMKAMNDEMGALMDEEAKTRGELEGAEAGMGLLKRAACNGCKRREAREREEEPRSR